MKKSHIAKLDSLWSKKVKELSGYRDQLTGGAGKESHHFITRTNRALRWWLPNGICLSVENHTGNTFSAHKSPKAFKEAIRRRRGEDWYKEIMQRKNRIFKGSYGDVLDYLNGEANDYL
jgi:hypothetical protein